MVEQVYRLKTGMNLSQNKKNKCTGINILFDFDTILKLILKVYKTRFSKPMPPSVVEIHYNLNILIYIGITINICIYNT